MNDPLPSEYLPDSIRELLHVLTPASVYAIVDEYGGSRLNIPKFADADHELVMLIGLDELTKLCKLLGGTLFTCPRCTKALNKLRDDSILKDKRAGLTLGQLARKYKLTEKAISNCLTRANQHEYQTHCKRAQSDLFAIC